MYYRGRRVPLSGGGNFSLRPDAPIRREVEKRTTFKLSWPGTAEQSRQRTVAEPPSRRVVEDPAFYRPARTTLEQLRDRRDAVSEEPRTSQTRKKIGGKRFPSMAMKGVVLLLLLVVVAWAKVKVTEALQNAAGLKLSLVKVTGARYMDEEDVLTTAALPIGENMYKLNIPSAESRVAKMGWVNHVYFERRLPRTLVIAIKERRPVALLDSSGLYGVDSEGRVLPSSRSLIDEDLPLLSGVDVPADAVGTTRLAGRLMEGLQFLIFLGKKDKALARDVSEVSLAERGTLKVTFVDGVEAKFGPGVSETELKRMAAVLSDLGSKGKRASTMDFRYRDSVFVRTRD